MRQGPSFLGLCLIKLYSRCPPARPYHIRRPRSLSQYDGRARDNNPLCYTAVACVTAVIPTVRSTESTMEFIGSEADISAASCIYLAKVPTKLSMSWIFQVMFFFLFIFLIFTHKVFIKSKQESTRESTRPTSQESTRTPQLSPQRPALAILNGLLAGKRRGT